MYILDWLSRGVDTTIDCAGSSQLDCRLDEHVVLAGSMHIWRPYGYPNRMAGQLPAGKQQPASELAPQADSFTSPSALADYNGHVDSLRGGSSRRSRPWKSARSTTSIGSSSGSSSSRTTARVSGARGAQSHRSGSSCIYSCSASDRDKYTRRGGGGLLSLRDSSALAQPPLTVATADYAIIIGLVLMKQADALKQLIKPWERDAWWHAWPAAARSHHGPPIRSLRRSEFHTALRAIVRGNEFSPTSWLAASQIARLGTAVSDAHVDALFDSLLGGRANYHVDALVRHIVSTLRKLRRFAVIASKEADTSGDGGDAGDGSSDHGGGRNGRGGRGGGRASEAGTDASLFDAIAERMRMLLLNDAGGDSLRESTAAAAEASRLEAERAAAEARVHKEREDAERRAAVVEAARIATAAERKRLLAEESKTLETMRKLMRAGIPPARFASAREASAFFSCPSAPSGHSTGGSMGGAGAGSEGGSRRGTYLAPSSVWLGNDAAIALSRYTAAQAGSKGGSAGTTLTGTSSSSSSSSSSRHSSNRASSSGSSCSASSSSATPNTSGAQRSPLPFRPLSPARVLYRVSELGALEC